MPILLQVPYAVRGGRQLMEQLDFKLLFRWFVSLSLDEPIWQATVFSKNRDRLLAGESPPPSCRASCGRARRGGCCRMSTSPVEWNAPRSVGESQELSADDPFAADWIFMFTMAAYNLVRIRTLIRVGVCGT